MHNTSWGEHPEGSTKDVLEDVEIERLKQHQKWGEQNHDIYRWLAILTEEVGEAAQAALHAEFESGAAEKVREEMIQVAAVAVQIVECLDRHKQTRCGALVCVRETNHPGSHFTEEEWAKASKPVADEAHKALGRE